MRETRRGRRQKEGKGALEGTRDAASGREDDGVGGGNVGDTAENRDETIKEEKRGKTTPATSLERFRFFGTLNTPFT